MSSLPGESRRIVEMSAVIDRVEGYTDAFARFELPNPKVFWLVLDDGTSVKVPELPPRGSLSVTIWRTGWKIVDGGTMGLRLEPDGPVGKVLYSDGREFVLITPDAKEGD